MSTEDLSLTDTIQEIAEQQRVYWNSPEGDKWVNNQAVLDRMFVPMTEILLEKSNVKAGEKILDIGCGAGTTTGLLAHKVGARGEVLGVDISTALLVAARAQIKENHVQFIEGDAGTVQLPMRDADLIFSRFGVMFFADPAQTFSHLRKYLKPSGRLCFVCWGARQDNPWFGAPYDVITSRLGELEPPPPRAPGPMAFARTDYIQEILKAAKFDNIIIETQDVDLISREGPEHTAEFMMSFGPGARVLSKFDVDNETKQLLSNDLAERLKTFMVEDGLRVPARLHFVRATNPR